MNDDTAEVNEGIEEVALLRVSTDRKLSMKDEISSDMVFDYF